MSLNTSIPPPLVALFLAFLIWIMAYYVPGPNWATKSVNIFAGILLFIGLLIEVISIRSFRRQKTTIMPFNPYQTSSLVISGLYRFSRNPMYFGMLLTLTAWVLYLGHPVGLIGLVLFVLYMNEFQIKPEEKAMHEKFGDEYATYQDRVRRWI